MSTQDNQHETAAPEEAVTPETVEVETQEAEVIQPDEVIENPENAAQAALAAKEEAYLRLAAEYDNFRKRSQREKELAYADSKSSAAVAFLPVYDNLERALKQETSDEAYKKGVEMTMTQFKDVLTKLGIEEIPALGETFDPNYHNAVMHVEDEAAGENQVVEVFQAGFKLGEKVIRFAMVKVAN